MKMKYFIIAYQFWEIYRAFSLPFVKSNNFWVKIKRKCNVVVKVTVLSRVCDS